MSDVVSDETTVQIAAGKRSGAPDPENDSVGLGTKKARIEQVSEESSTAPSGDSAGYAWETKLNALYTAGKLVTGDLDEGAVMQLKQVPTSVAMACLDHLGQADLSEVRSKSAYLVGIIRRLNNASGPVESTTDVDGDVHSMESTMAMLPTSVQNKLRHIFNAGSVDPTDLEPRVLQELMEFGEAGACTILERYASKNLSSVRNKTAFLIGVIKRYREEVKNGPSGGAGSRGGGGAGGGSGGDASAAMSAVNMTAGSLGTQQAVHQAITMQSPKLLQEMGLLSAHQVNTIQGWVTQNMVAKEAQSSASSISGRMIGNTMTPSYRPPPPSHNVYSGSGGYAAGGSYQYDPAMAPYNAQSYSAMPAAPPRYGPPAANATLGSYAPSTSSYGQQQQNHGYSGSYY